MGNYILTSSGELYHYGVKGMKWGVRRYQNEDGTLTDAGKERYYDDDERKSLYEQSKSHVVKNSLTGRHSVVDNEDVTKAGGFLWNQSEKISDVFNEMSESYNTDISNMKTNSKFMSEVKKLLNDEFGGPDQVDDEVLLNWSVDDIIYDSVEKYTSQRTKDLGKKFNDGVTQYYNNIKAITDDIVGSYGDMPVASIDTTRKTGGLFGRTTVSKEPVNYRTVVENTLADIGDSSWVRYLNNHTESAWIDSDSIYELADEIKKQWGYSK